MTGFWLYLHFLPLNFLFKKENNNKYKTAQKTLQALTKKQYFMFLLIPIENSFLAIARVSSCDSYPHHLLNNSTISQQG